MTDSVQAQPQTQDTQAQPQQNVQQANNQAQNIQNTANNNQDSNQNNNQPQQNQSQNNSNFTVDNPFSDFYNKDKQQQALNSQQNQNINYEFKNADGSKVTDETQLKMFSDVSKDLNLSQENAQKLYEKAVPMFIQYNQKMVNNQIETWKNEVMNDAEIGQNNLNITRENCQKALARYGNDELNTLLEATGLGANPTVIKFLNNIGKSISNDQNFISGQQQNKPKEKNFLELMYG